jgi:hypothetical protein
LVFRVGKKSVGGRDEKISLPLDQFIVDLNCILMRCQIDLNMFLTSLNT